jgi:hypothetical protein
MMYQTARSDQFGGSGAALESVIAPANLENGATSGYMGNFGPTQTSFAACLNGTTTTNSVSDTNITSADRNFWAMSPVEACKLASNGFDLKETSWRTPYGWWLRSPGDFDAAAYVYTADNLNDDSVYTYGNFVSDIDFYSARPALFINLSSLQ